MPEHISSQFNQELEQVRTEVMHMGGLVEKQLEGVLKAFETVSPHDLKPIIDGDAAINKLEVEIDDHCQTIIARRQPAAGDLRFVMTIIRTIVDLERIGDEVKKIALLCYELSSNNRVTADELHDVARMGKTTLTMLRRALDSFARLDKTALIELAETDSRLDSDYRSQTRSRITYMMEDPRSIGSNIDIMFMAKAVERIGDHAVNIAEHIVYLTDGIDVRHQHLDTIRNSIN